MSAPLTPMVDVPAATDAGTPGERPPCAVERARGQTEAGRQALGPSPRRQGAYAVASSTTSASRASASRASAFFNSSATKAFQNG